jgi:hypothetical protein
MGAKIPAKDTQRHREFIRDTTLTAVRILVNLLSASTPPEVESETPENYSLPIENSDSENSALSSLSNVILDGFGTSALSSTSTPNLKSNLQKPRNARRTLLQSFETMETESREAAKILKQEEEEEEEERKPEENTYVSEVSEVSELEVKAGVNFIQTHLAMAYPEKFKKFLLSDSDTTGSSNTSDTIAEEHSEDEGQEVGAGNKIPHPVIKENLLSGDSDTSARSSFSLSPSSASLSRSNSADPSSISPQSSDLSDNGYPQSDSETSKNSLSAPISRRRHSSDGKVGKVVAQLSSGGLKRTGEEAGGGSKRESSDEGEGIAMKGGRRRVSSDDGEGTFMNPEDLGRFSEEALAEFEYLCAVKKSEIYQKFEIKIAYLVEKMKNELETEVYFPSLLSSFLPPPSSLLPPPSSLFSSFSFSSVPSSSSLRHFSDPQHLPREANQNRRAPSHTWPENYFRSASRRFYSEISKGLSLPGMEKASRNNFR